MTNPVNLERDDAAKLIPARPPTERTVNPVQPYPGTQPVQPRGEAAATPKKPRRQLQRRKGERRKQNIPVLLDTRSGRDRRNAVSAAGVELEGDSETPPHTGIDVYT